MGSFLRGRHLPLRGVTTEAVSVRHRCRWPSDSTDVGGFSLYSRMAVGSVELASQTIREQKQKIPEDHKGQVSAHASSPQAASSASTEPNGTATIMAW